MVGRIVFRVLLALVLVVALVAVAGWIAAGAYHTGFLQGAQQAGKSLPVPQGGAPVPLPWYAYAPYWLPPFGFGFGLLGCLMPLLFLFLVFSLVRVIVGGGSRRWRHHGWEENDPHGPWRRHGRWSEMAEEWHRQQHSGEAGNPSGAGEQKS